MSELTPVIEWIKTRLRHLKRKKGEDEKMQKGIVPLPLFRR